MSVRKLLVAAVLVLLLFSFLAAALDVSPPKSSSSKSSSSSSSSSSVTTTSGHSSKRIVNLELDDFLAYVEKWNQEASKDKSKKKEFDRVRSLLYNPGSIENYTRPAVQIAYNGDTNITRGQEIEVMAYVWNKNPEALRSNLNLWLEARWPGSDDFETVADLQPKVILKNEYDKTTGSVIRRWSNITPFEDIKATGTVEMRIKVDDQHSIYESSDQLKLTLKNNAANMTNLSLIGPDPARYSDPLIYRSNVTDLDGDMVNVTLHILDGNGTEISSAPQEVKPGTVDFRSAEYGFFGEDDAGKSFQYYYTYSDGLNSSNTTIMPGPRFKPSPKIEVSNLEVVPESANAYWWQRYNFSVQVRNPSSDEVKVSLITSTPANPEKFIGEQVVMPGEEKTVSFVAYPFDVSDCNCTFSYSFRYSAPDQYGADQNGTLGMTVSPKLVKYPIYSPWMMVNIVLLILIPIVPIIARRFSISIPSLGGGNLSKGLTKRFNKKGGD